MPRKEPSSQQRGSRNEFLRRFGDSHEPIPAALAATADDDPIAANAVVKQSRQPGALRRSRVHVPAGFETSCSGHAERAPLAAYKSVMEA
jgi:hypothetical protein